jgi:hypothetical protein
MCNSRYHRDYVVKYSMFKLPTGKLRVTTCRRNEKSWESMRGVSLRIFYTGKQTKSKLVPACFCLQIIGVLLIRRRPLLRCLLPPRRRHHHPIYNKIRDGKLGCEPQVRFLENGSSAQQKTKQILPCAALSC